MNKRSGYAVWVNNRLNCTAFTFSSAYKLKEHFIVKGSNPKCCFITRDNIDLAYISLVPREVIET
jgi:hypothetical protein